MLDMTIKISKIAARKALKKAAKTGTKAVVRVPKTSTKIAMDLFIQFGKICLGAGSLFVASEFIRTSNKFAYEKGICDDIRFVKNSVQNAINDNR